MLPAWIIDEPLAVGPNKESGGSLSARTSRDDILMSNLNL